MLSPTYKRRVWLLAANLVALVVFAANQKVAVTAHVIAQRPDGLVHIDSQGSTFRIGDKIELYTYDFYEPVPWAEVGSPVLVRKTPIVSAEVVEVIDSTHILAKMDSPVTLPITDRLKARKITP